MFTIWALPSPNSMKRSICFLKQAQLCSMVSRVIMERMSVRPEGSPIMAVPPPMRAMGRLPAICRRFIRVRAIEVAHVEAVRRGVEADVEHGLAVVDDLADLLLVGDLGDKAPGFQFFVDLHG